MKTYWFIFNKGDVMLEKLTDGTYTIPCCERVPVETTQYTHILNVSPMEDGTVVKACLLYTSDAADE